AKHPTTKMLALAFLLLIGVSLAADGLGFHIEKGYIYAAMGFSVLVEAVNIFAKQRKLARGAKPHVTAGTAARQHLAAEAAGGSVATAATGAPAVTGTPAKPRAKSTASRSQSRPKSAPRKKS